MEISAPKIAMALVAVLALGGGAAWLRSDVVMRQRLHDLRGAIGAISHDRGGRLPGDADVRARVEALAAERGVALEELAVGSRVEDGPGAVVERVGGPLASALRGRTRVYEVRARARTTELLFVREEPIATRIELRVSLELAPQPGSSSAPPRVLGLEDVRRDLQPRGL